MPNCFVGTSFLWLRVLLQDGREIWARSDPGTQIALNTFSSAPSIALRVSPQEALKMSSDEPIDPYQFVFLFNSSYPISQCEVTSDGKSDGPQREDEWQCCREPVIQSYGRPDIRRQHRQHLSDAYTIHLLLDRSQRTSRRHLAATAPTPSTYP